MSRVPKVSEAWSDQRGVLGSCRETEGEKEKEGQEGLFLILESVGGCGGLNESLGNLEWTSEIGRGRRRGSGKLKGRKRKRCLGFLKNVGGFGWSKGSFGRL